MCEERAVAASANGKRDGFGFFPMYQQTSVKLMMVPMVLAVARYGEVISPSLRRRIGLMVSHKLATYPSNTPRPNGNIEVSKYDI